MHWVPEILTLWPCFCSRVQRETLGCLQVRLHQERRWGICHWSLCPALCPSALCYVCLMTSRVVTPTISLTGSFWFMMWDSFFFLQCCEMIPKCWHSSYSRVSTKDYSASHKILNSFHSWWWKTDFSFNFTRRFQHTGKLIFKYCNNDFEGMVFFIPMNSFYIDFKAFFMHFWVILLSFYCLTSSRLAFA